MRQPLDQATEAALRASIQRFGVIVPVVVDQHGNLLDGHNRQRIAADLGVPCPEQRITVRDADEAKEVARTLNEDRRHMPKAQRLAVVKVLRDQGHSTRAIAAAVGVSQQQVSKDVRQVTTSCQVPAPAAVQGLDGKTYKPRAVRERPAKGVAFERKDEILELRRRGKSQTAIAQELGTYTGAIQQCLRTFGDPAVTTKIGGRTNAIDSDGVVARIMHALTAEVEMLTEHVRRTVPDPVTASEWKAIAAEVRRTMLLVIKHADIHTRGVA